MQKICPILSLCTLLALSGCTPAGGESSSSEPSNKPALSEAQWTEARRLLPENLWSPQVVETNTTKADPAAEEAARFLAGALVAFPAHPLPIDGGNPPSELFLLHTGLLGTDGVQLGMPGTEGAIYRQVDELLGRPGAFLTAEQVEKAAARFFPQGEIIHQTLPLPDGSSFAYRADLALYTYPDGEARWYEPVLLAYSEDADGVCWAKIAFVRSAKEAGEAHYNWADEPMGSWAVEEELLQNPEKYPRWEVLLQRGEEGFTLLSILPAEEDSPVEGAPSAAE